MVDLEPMDDTDREALLDLVRRHLDETGSVVAERLLGSWETAVDDFVKVMPKDYKRVLLAKREAEEKGTDVTEAIMAASRA